MRSLFALLLCAITFVSCNYFVSDTTSFELSFGPGVFNELNLVLQTSDNGYLVGGYSIFNNDPNLTMLPTKALVAKLSNTGELLKETTLAFSNNDELTHGIGLADGTYLLLGGTQNKNGRVDILTVLLNDKGDTISSFIFGTELDDVVQAAVQDLDGSIWVLTNQTNDLLSTQASSNTIVHHLSAPGRLLSSVALPDTNNSYAYDMELVQENQLLLFGKTRDSLDVEHGAVWQLNNDSLQLMTEPLVGEQSIGASVAISGSEYLLAAPIDNSELILRWLGPNSVTSSSLPYNKGTELVSLDRYYNNNYLLGLNVTEVHKNYYEYLLELRSMDNNELVWRSDTSSTEVTNMLHHVAITTDSGFVVAGFKDIPEEGSKAYVRKLPKPEIFGTSEAF